MTKARTNHAADEACERFNRTVDALLMQKMVLPPLNEFGVEAAPLHGFTTLPGKPHGPDTAR